MFKRTHILSLVPSLAGLFLTTAASAQDNRQFFDAPWIGYDTAVYPEGLWPNASVAGDFNLDGIPDLATVSWGGTPWLSLLLGDGVGGYLPPQTTALPMEAFDLAAADFDLDGDLDLVINNTGRFWEGGSFSLWRNDGEGGFSLGGHFDAGNSGPNGIATGDFNGDGYPDVAIAHDAYIVSNNTASVILNNGVGGFNSPWVFVLRGGTNDVATGDVTGDGLVDVIVGFESGGFAVLRNVNSATFTVEQDVRNSAGPKVHVVDWDQDGDVDLFMPWNIAFGEGAVALFRNDGAGNLGAAEVTAFPGYSGVATGFATADLTGDGWNDLVATTDFSEWWFIRGDGSGGFVPPEPLQCGQGLLDADASDLDGDGDLDLTILGSRSLEACVYLNPGNGGFIQPPVLDLVPPSFAPAFPTNLLARDIDGDGDLDLVLGYRSDFEEEFGISVRRNNGDGTFAPIELYPDVTYPLSIELADMDGDGDLDLLYIDSTQRTRIRKNDGAGNFNTRISRHVMQGVTEVIRAVDIDGDSDLDIAADSGFSIGFSMNLGNDNYAAPIYHELPDSVAVYEFGDFNHDGRLDLLTDTGVQGYPQISLGNGNGTFGTANTVPTGRDVHAFAVGHLDGDGFLDFAAKYNLDESGLSIRRGRGTGNFFLNQNYHGSYFFDDQTGTLDLFDIDGDGALDALTANDKAQDMSFWRNRGDGTFDRLVRFGVAQPAWDIEVGDFNGDGYPDAAIATEIAGSRWWHNGVVMVWGKAPGAAVPATLTDATVQFGTLISGTVDSMRSSDDVRYEVQSGFGFSALEANLVEIVIGAETGVAAPQSFDLRIEARIDHPTGTAQVRLRNWSANRFEQIHQYTIGMTETAEEIPGVNAANRVRDPGGEGRIEVMWRQSVVATFSLAGFRSSTDHVGIGVR